MEKAGGVFFSLLMGGVLCFALVKIYSHKDKQWAAAHPDHMVATIVQTTPQATAPQLPCRK